MGTRSCGHKSSVSSPCVGEAGKTGDWRSERPVIDKEKCLAVKAGKAACFRCWAFCPEAVFSKEVGSEPDLTYCKGCGICAEVCPAGAITMVSEAEAKAQEQNAAD